MAKKKTKKIGDTTFVPEKTPSSFTFEIPAEEPSVCFKIKDDVIEDKVATLHRLLLESQHEGGASYEETFAERLYQKYGVEVSVEAAFRISYHLYNLFETEKKSMDT